MREHLFQHCAQYEAARHHTHNVSRGATLSTVLGTRNGITKLADFLRASGALTKTGMPRVERAAPLFSDKPNDDDMSREEGEEEEQEEEQEE